MSRWFWARRCNPKRGTGCSRRLLVLRLGVALTLAGASSAAAGPPLISDDPHTVGRSVFEGIIAIDVIRQNEVTSITAPTFDATFGVDEGLDVTLVAAPVFDIVSSDDDDTSETVEVGLKWQPIQSETWNLSLSPALGTGAVRASRFEVTIPAQVEYTFKHFSLGSDAAYIFVANGDDGWRAGQYATIPVDPSLVLALEVWALGTRSPRIAEVGVGGGFDWAATPQVHLLMAAGSGVAASGIDRADWYLYAGIQWVACCQ